MTPAEFIKKWKPVALTERSAAHTHFLDLCKLFEHDDPVSADPTGEWFTFEKGATKTGGGEGFADVRFPDNELLIGKAISFTGFPGFDVRGEDDLIALRTSSTLG